MYWELFVEKIAEVLALALTDKESEMVIKSFHTFTARIREISHKNLQTLASEKESIRPHCQHHGKCRANCLRGFIRSFASAYSVKWLVSVVQLMLHRRLNWKTLFSGFDSDTFKFSLFFSSFIAAYKGLNCLMRKLRQTDDHWNSFTAGSLAGMALLLDEKSRRRAIMLYLVTRALQLAYLTGIKYHRLPSVPHGDTLLMGACNAQIIYAWMCYPQTLNRSYYNWIYNLADLSFFHGKQHAREAAKCLSMISIGQQPPKDIIQPLLEKSEAILRFSSPESTNHVYDACALTHPNTTSCTMGALNYSGRCFPKALQMYLPLNVGMMVLFKHKLLRKNPAEWLKRLILGSTRSSLFITLFASVAWIPLCYSRSIAGREWHPAYMINGFLSGSTVLLETKSRRIELALYCLPRALESFWNLGVLRGHFRSIRNGEVLLFMIAMGTLMTVYQHEPDVIPRSYEGILVRFFGVN